MAKRVAALGGWPHIDIYEQTAHTLGEHRALSGISLENPDWARHEERLIERAIHGQPHAIIGLTDGYLPDDRILDLIRRCTDVVTIELDWLSLQERLLDEIESEPERLPEFIEQEVPDLHTLQILYKQRAALYAQATIPMDAKGCSPSIVAHRVTAAIKSLS